MKIPRIRFYLDDDFSDVVNLLKENDYSCPERTEDLNGIALVAHDDSSDDLIGFVWALAAEGVTTAYSDYFVISKKYRKSYAGLFLLLTLIKLLSEKGVQRVIGVVPPGNGSYLKMLRKRGVKVAPNHSVILAKTDVLVGVGSNGS